MLTIHGVTRSRASRLIWLCHEIALPFRQIPVIQAYRLADPYGADAPLNTRSPAFLALSPAGAVPVIDDDGLILSESLAATLYLARKYGGAMGPRDASEDAMISQWTFFAACSIESDALTILMLGRAPDPDDQAFIADAVARLDRPLRVIQTHLERHAHLVGDRFTVADLNMAEIIRYAWGHADLPGRYPAIDAWLGACQNRPAFQRMWAERLAEPE